MYDTLTTFRTVFGRTIIITQCNNSTYYSNYRTNFAFRDYFQGAIKTNDTYLGNVITSAAASGVREAVIAVPVYSLKDNSTIAGVWAGGIIFNILDKELQPLKLPSGERVVYIGHKGQKIADSNTTSSNQVESFADLQSFKNAVNFAITY